ncbi:MAG: hypothetical protein LIP10_03425 [Clostridiales bacterium]|nr:hypothetical protein [Clostridiales bacterium]
MDDKTYSVELSDGTMFENLSINGSYYVTDQEITEDIFDGNCNAVTVSDGETTSTLTNMELINIIKFGDSQWGFALREMTPEELATMQVRSDIDYIAMMTGVEL